MPPAAAMREGGGAALAGVARQRRTTSFPHGRRRRHTNQINGSVALNEASSKGRRLPGIKNSMKSNFLCQGVFYPLSLPHSGLQSHLLPGQTAPDLVHLG